MSNFFRTAVENLGIEKTTGYEQATVGIDDPVEADIHKFEKHPSVLKIKDMIKGKGIEQFNFSKIDAEVMENEIKQINSTKATTFKNIPPKVLKQSVDVCTPILQDILNKAFDNGEFPDKLKLADVHSVFKKIDSTNKSNYRPVSVLPTVSKPFERIMQKQIGTYMARYLSEYLSGYRKGYSAQHALISLTERWKSSLDNNGYAGAVLMDLSKCLIS